MAKVEEYYEVVREGWSDSKVGDDFVSFGGDYEFKNIALNMGGGGDVVVVVGGRMASHGPKSMCERQNSPWV